MTSCKILRVLVRLKMQFLNSFILSNNIYGKLNIIHCGKGVYRDHTMKLWEKVIKHRLREVTGIV